MPCRWGVCRWYRWRRRVRRGNSAGERPRWRVDCARLGCRSHSSSSKKTAFLSKQVVLSQSEFRRPSAHPGKTRFGAGRWHRGRPGCVQFSDYRFFTWIQFYVRGAFGHADGPGPSPDRGRTGEYAFGAGSGSLDPSIWERSGGHCALPAPSSRAARSGLL